MSKPKILTFDIETAPIEAYTWGLFDQNVGLNQIKEDWYFLAWAAKWLGDKPSKSIYMDNRNAKDIRNDKKLIEGLAALVNEADIVITQNGKSFDVKKLNARAVIHGLPPIKNPRHTDILKEGRKVFKFTSHKLEYVSGKLNKKYKKLKHGEYPGFELWKAVLNGDKKAWNVMKKYAIHDVLATEEAYINIQGWIKTQNFAAYYDDLEMRCTCGSTNLIKKGPVYTDAGKFQGYKCKNCGKRPKGKTNLLSTEKKRKLLKEGR
jgi:DNA polymerase elongation subunit (family B)